MCHACRGTRLVTDPTGTVHARGSEMKMPNCCTASLDASTLGMVFRSMEEGLIAVVLRFAPASHCGPCTGGESSSFNALRWASTFDRFS
jgi:hypothetical protein